MLIITLQSMIVVSNCYAVKRIKICSIVSWLFILAHLGQSLSWTFLIKKCPASVCPSIRPCVVNFSIFHCMPSHQTYHNCSSIGRNFLKRLEIQDGCHLSLIGRDNFIFPKQPHMKTPDFPEMFLKGFWRSVTFFSDSNSKVAIQASDWLLFQQKVHVK